jgi:hypothetical protein
MPYDAIKALRDAGNPVDQLNDAQRSVLGTLSPEEVTIINDVHARMAVVGSDVEGQTVVGVGVF